MKKKSFIWAVIVATMMVGALGLWAQGTATLTGTVSDPSGAVIPGAKVTATHLATNVSYRAETQSNGVYRITSLPVGSYTLTIESEGFRAFRIEDVVLTVGETAKQSATMEVGAVTEVVTVEGGGVQLVQTQDTKVRALIDTTTLHNLPLEIREPNAFVNLAPGLVDGNTISEAIGTVSRGPAVHGARSGMGNWTVDGFDNNDQGQGGRGSGIPGGATGAKTGISPEAVSEFEVITSNFEAQHGRGGGFVVNVTLKGGGNDFHGSVFEYNRVQKLAANAWASNKGGVQDSRVRNQFGGAIGGPIIKDKSFFHFSAEWHRLRESAPGSFTTTTPEFIDFVRSGAFATFHESDPNGTCVLILGAACPGAFALSSTTGPIFEQLEAATPLTLATSGTRINTSGEAHTGGFTYPVPVFGTINPSIGSLTNQARFSVKVDHNFSSNDYVTGMALIDDADTAGDFGGDVYNAAVPFQNPGRNQNYGVTWRHTFSPTAIFEGRISYLRDRADFPQNQDTEFPSIYTTFDPLTVGYGLTANLPQFFTNNQFQYQGNQTFIRGSHTIKMGGEYRRTRNGSAFEALKNGIMSPSDVENLLTDGAFGDEFELQVYGGFVLGGFGFAFGAIDPSNPGEFPEFYRGFRGNEFGAYVQDTWRVHPRLTLTLGLRWEYQGPVHNFRKGIDSELFFGSPGIPSPAVNPSWASCDGVAAPTDNPFFPCDRVITQMFAGATFIQKDRNLWAKDTDNWAPRFGFAWDVFGDSKFVARGGGGVFYDRMWNNLFENIRFNPPFHAFAGTGFFGDGIAFGPLSRPGVYTLTPDPSLFTGVGLPGTRDMDENLQLPWIAQYYLGVQWEFMKDWAFHATYNMTQGRKLTGLIDDNTFPGRTAGGGFSSARPNPNIGAASRRTNAWDSIYHGGEVQVIKRFSQGLLFQANYTYSRSIDNLSDAFSGKDNLKAMSNLNLDIDRGRSDFDIQNRFVASGYYEVPWMNDNRWIGGWSFGGSITMQDGIPFTIHCSCDSNKDGQSTAAEPDRAEYVGSGPVESVLTGGHPGDGFFNTTDSNGAPLFVSPIGGPGAGADGISGTADDRPAGRFFGPPGSPGGDGVLGRNILDGPGLVNVDLNISKKFRIRESMALTFQANFFNLFNRPNFLLPAGNITSPSFGRSTNTFAPRVIQLAVRFDF